MNLYKEMNKNEIKLLENAGINIEDKEYKNEDLKQFESKIVEYIMSASSKNGEIDKRRNKYDSIFRVIVSK